MPRRHRVAKPKPQPQPQQEEQKDPAPTPTNLTSSRPVSSNAGSLAQQSRTTSASSTSTTSSSASSISAASSSASSSSNTSSSWSLHFDHTIQFQLIGDESCRSSGLCIGMRFELNQTMVALQIPPASFKRYCDHLSIEFTASLKFRPLTITNDVHIQQMAAGKLIPSDVKFIAELRLNKPISPQVLVLKDSNFGTKEVERFKECSMRVVSLFEGLTSQTTGFDDTVMYMNNERLIDALLFSEHTVHEAPYFLQWNFQQPNKREMVAVSRSVKCLSGHESQWEDFLKDMNRRIARYLPNYPTKQMAEQNASAVVLSNYQRELMITIKFPQRTIKPTLQIVQHLSVYLMAVIKCARYNQLETHPNQAYARMIQHEMEERTRFGPFR